MEEEMQERKEELRLAKKTYQCALCDNVYQTPLGLREYEASQVGKTMYSCKIFFKKYKYSSNVAAHVKRVHRKES